MRCLGKVNIEISMLDETLKLFQQPAGGAGSNIPEEKEMNSYFYLGKDCYVPLSENNETENSKERCDSVYEESKKKPQVVGKVDKSATKPPNVAINSEMLNRLWLYDGKVYTDNRNDYSEELVFLLIRDCIDKEKSKFNELRKKFKLD